MKYGSGIDYSLEQQIVSGTFYPLKMFPWENFQLLSSLVSTRQHLMRDMMHNMWVILLNGNEELFFVTFLKLCACW